MGEGLEIAKVLVSPCEKLMTMVGNAIGTVYEPRHIRKMADAHAYELSTVGAAMREFADIKTTYENGSVALFTEDFHRLMQRTQNRIALQEITRQQNIESVLDNAYEQLESESDVTNEPVDQDWTCRFFNIIEDISNSEMQELWAHILAGEIKRPGSFSMRTLETIRNMSTEEAEIFQNILPYIINAGDDLAFVLADEDIQKQFGILDGHYMKMNSCGLIQMLPFTALNHNLLSGTVKKIFMTDDRLLSITNASEKDINLRINEIYLLTNSGKELFDCFVSSPNNEYFEEWVRKLYKVNKCSGLIFEVHERLENCSQKKYKNDPILRLSKD